MENKSVGLMVIGISLVMIGVIFLFNSALKDIISTSCTEHGTSCPMYDTVTKQTALSLGIVAILIFVGIVIMFNKPKEKVVIKKVLEKKKKLDLEGLERDEKKVVKLLLLEKGGMFQADLMEKLEMGKVKLTRLLDKLESKGILERKRRGMNNIVILNSGYMN